MSKYFSFVLVLSLGLSILAAEPYTEKIEIGWVQDGTKNFQLSYTYSPSISEIKVVNNSPGYIVLQFEDRTYEIAPGKSIAYGQHLTKKEKVTLKFGSTDNTVKKIAVFGARHFQGKGRITISASTPTRGEF